MQTRCFTAGELLPPVSTVSKTGGNKPSTAAARIVSRARVWTVRADAMVAVASISEPTRTTAVPAATHAVEHVQTGSVLMILLM